MPNQVSERLKSIIPSIMKIWEARAIEEIEAALPHTSLVLQDSLPEFLSQIVMALSTKIDRNAIRVKWDRSESTRIGKKHGRERAANLNYTMDQLIWEYHILREVVCTEMEIIAPLNDIEREIIICAVEQAVNDAATQFSESHREVQEKFTSTLAHDLRGPITATKLNAQLLLKNPEEFKSLAQKIATSMDRLDYMINDLLDASRLRAGEKLELVLEDCDLNQIITQVSEEANTLYENRIQFTPDGTIIGKWNDNGLRRILDNLITNALKFSTPGTPVKINLSENSTNVEFSVHNTGLPITDEEIPDLFLPFKRVRTAAGKVGWGLGLTVVKGLTEAHGGEVKVESSKEAGTTFRIILPFIKK
jgi:signal transduction histidine kinase